MKHSKYLLAALVVLISFASKAQDQKKERKDSLYHRDNGGQIYTGTEIDSAASYVPGINALYKFIAGNLVYPMDAKESGISGRVFASFVVEKSGALSDIIIIKSLHPSCDSEVIRLLKTLPGTWRPAQKSGQPVRSQWIMPFSFKMTR